MARKLFQQLIELLSRISSKKILYVHKRDLKAKHTAVYSAYNFWYTGDIFDQSDIAYGILSNGDIETYDTKVVNTLLQKLTCEKDIIVYDIGANTGWYSMLAATFPKVVSVHSFEPVAEHTECLRETIFLNRYEDKITVHEIALSDTNGTSTISLAGSGSSLETSFVGTNHATRTIKTKTIDSMLTTALNNQEPDFIKIDVEGHEYKVLQGAKNMLTKKKPALFIEIAKSLENKNSSFKHPDYDQILKMLTEIGYEIFVTANNTLISYVENTTEHGVFMYLCLHKDLHEKELLSIHNGEFNN